MFFEKNLDVIFFFYGLAFLFMGLVILIQLRVTKISQIRLLDVLPPLAWFGIIHGANELVDMFAIWKGESGWLAILSPVILALSYFFIIMFGYRLINLDKKRVGLWLLPICAAAYAALPAMFVMTDYHYWNISARYFLGFPGITLSALGLFVYYLSNSNNSAVRVVRIYFWLAAIFLALYGILSGLFVSPANFFPASVINARMFLSFVGLPVQFFRGLCAIVIAWSVWNITNIFNIELDSLNKELRFEAKEVSRAEEALSQHKRLDEARLKEVK